MCANLFATLFGLTAFSPVFFQVAMFSVSLGLKQQHLNGNKLPSD